MKKSQEQSSGISRRQDGSNPQNNVLYHISIMKDERISVDAENTSNKIQQPFMIKFLKEV